MTYSARKLRRKAAIIYLFRKTFSAEGQEVIQFPWTIRIVCWWWRGLGLLAEGSRFSIYLIHVHCHTGVGGDGEETQSKWLKLSFHFEWTQIEPAGLLYGAISSETRAFSLIWSVENCWLLDYWKAFQHLLYYKRWSDFPDEPGESETLSIINA